MIKKYTWCVRKSTEYRNVNTFDTIDECINNARVLHEQGFIPNVIYIAETIPYKLRLDTQVVSDILADLHGNAIEDCGVAIYNASYLNKAHWGKSIQHEITGLTPDEIEELKSEIKD